MKAKPTKRDLLRTRVYRKRKDIILRERVPAVISIEARVGEAARTTAYKEHKGIAGAMIAGDAELAVQRLTDHNAFGRRVLIS